jgi:hypothetical protein
MAAAKYACVNEACRKQVASTKNSRYRSHSDGTGEPCEMSSMPIPDHVLGRPANGLPADEPQAGVDFAVCPQCTRKVKLTRMGYFEPHDQTLRGGDRCPVSGVRAKHARRQEDVPLPGDEPPRPGATSPEVSDERPEQMERARAALTSPAPTSESAPAESSPKELPPSGGTIDWSKVGDLKHLPSEESTSTSASSPPPSAGPSTSSDAPAETADAGPWPLAAGFDDRFLQPYSPFSQPGEIPARIKLADAMSDRGKELAARIRETFYAYVNRNTKDNRSAQMTMGPSEIGTSCDRQIAMKLLNIAPSNPQEGWAPFVGTAVHDELARMFQWANGGGAGSGRYVTEMSVEFGHPLVPRGTLDLLDRVLFMVDDHKLMGRWSLDKLIQEGPSETYRVQLHTYGYGAERAGEKVKEVALIAWPRQESSLDKLYVHVEPYDRKIALAALERVARIAERVRSATGEARDNGFISEKPLEVAQHFNAGDDCKWCPFHRKGDAGFTRGCPGK